MLIGILVGIVVVFGLISVFGGVLKKIMEVVSLIAKLCMCGGVAMLIVQLLGGALWRAGVQPLIDAAAGTMQKLFRHRQE